MILFRAIIFYIRLNFLVCTKLKPFKIRNFIMMHFKHLCVKIYLTCLHINFLASAILLKLNPDSNATISITAAQGLGVHSYQVFGFVLASSFFVVGKLACNTLVIKLHKWPLKVVSFVTLFNKNLDFSGSGQLMEFARNRKCAFMIISG